MADKTRGEVRHLTIYESNDELKLRTWVQLARTFYLITRRITSLLSQHDMTLPQFDVVATLRFSEGVSQQELADRLLVTKGNVCGVIDRLESLKWVERRADEKDRRTNRLYLTAAGRRKIDRVLPAHDNLVVHAMRPLSVNDVKVIRAILEQLAAANDGSA